MTELETAIADNRAAVEEFVAAARGLDAATWAAPRGESKWSPAQIAEHLAIVYEYNRKVVKGDGGGARPVPAAAGAVVHRDRTLKAGRFTRKGGRPGIFQPTARRRPRRPCSRG